MKRKLVLIIFLGLGIFSSCFSQDENRILKNEVSTNINYYLDNWIFPNEVAVDLINQEVGTQPLVLYRRFFENGLALHIGGNGFFKKKFESNIFGTIEESEEEKLSLLLRFGFQKSYPFSGKAIFFWGVDGLLSTHRFEAKVFLESFFIDNPYTKKRVINEIGVTPKLGFQYELSNRISLGVESNIIIVVSYFDDDVENNPFFTDPFDINLSNTKNTETLKIQLQEPLALFINYRF